MLFSEMKINSLLLMYVVAAIPQPSRAEEVNLQEVELEEFGRTETGGIAIKRGLSWGDGKRYTTTAAALLTDSYLAEFRLRREEAPRQRIEDEIKIAGITLAGTRRYRAYQADFTFGMKLAERARRWYDLTLYGQVTGGLQVVKNNLFIGAGEEQERLPGDPDVSFFAGGGGRGEAVFRIPRIGSYYFSVGLGAAVEYLKDMDGFVSQPVSGINYGAYGLVRLSRDRVMEGLRIKKE